MIIMSWLARWFGDVGAVRFVCTNAEGKMYEGTTHIESFNHSREEIEEKLRKILEVQTGQRMIKVKIIAFAES